VNTTPIVALDVASADAALAIVETLGDSCRFYKIGNELFTAEGPDVVRKVKSAGAEVFLDLKFHDIPNTVAGGVRNAAAMGVSLVTVHASGGRAMLEAAQKAVEGSRCGVLGVTILTSLDAVALGAAWGRRDVDVEQEVLRLARDVAEVGLHGLVCSGAEAAAVTAELGDALALLVPGIRLAGDSAHDQKRVVTPGVARSAGARYVVLGRAVTGASSPREAMARVLAELAG
jgi:orotidine-5'-phosphate decarboxylase